MHVFWNHSNCPTKFELGVFDAVIRAKLVYGLEAVQLPNHLINRLNTFQLKGLREILNMQTTFANRSNTNAKVFQTANRCKNPNNLPGKNVKSFGDYLADKRANLLKHIVRAPSEDPLRQATLEPGAPFARI